MADNGNEFGAFLSGLLIGGLVGAAAALLMAPQSGEETREQIKQRGIELRDRADEEIKHFRAQADQALADVRAQSAELQKKASTSLEEARTRVSGAIEEGKEAAKKIRSPKGGTGTTETPA